MRNTKGLDVPTRLPLKRCSWIYSAMKLENTTTKHRIEKNPIETHRHTRPTLVSLVTWHAMERMPSQWGCLIPLPYINDIPYDNKTYTIYYNIEIITLDQSVLESPQIRSSKADVSDGCWQFQNLFILTIYFRGVILKNGYRKSYKVKRINVLYNFLSLLFYSKHEYSLSRLHYFLNKSKNPKISVLLSWPPFSKLTSWPRTRRELLVLKLTS